MFKYYLLFINIFSLCLYYIDKRKAIKRKYRFSEKFLITLSIIGGCYGSIIGMYLFRHKTKHLKFTILVPIFCILWLIIILKKLHVM